MRLETKVVGLMTRHASEANCLRSGAFYVVTGKTYIDLKLFKALFPTNFLVSDTASLWL